MPREWESPDTMFAITGVHPVFLNDLYDSFSDPSQASGVVEAVLSSGGFEFGDVSEFVSSDFLAVASNVEDIFTPSSRPPRVSPFEVLNAPESLCQDFVVSLKREAGEDFLFDYGVVDFDCLVSLLSTDSSAPAFARSVASNWSWGSLSSSQQGVLLDRFSGLSYRELMVLLSFKDFPVSVVLERLRLWVSQLDVSDSRGFDDFSAFFASLPRFAGGWVDRVGLGLVSPCDLSVVLDFCEEVFSAVSTFKGLPFKVLVGGVDSFVELICASMSVESDPSFCSRARDLVSRFSSVVGHEMQDFADFVWGVGFSVPVSPSSLQDSFAGLFELGVLHSPVFSDSEALEALVSSRARASSFLYRFRSSGRGEEFLSDWVLSRLALPGNDRRYSFFLDSTFGFSEQLLLDLVSREGVLVSFSYTDLFSLPDSVALVLLAGEEDVSKRFVLVAGLGFDSMVGFLPEFPELVFLRDFWEGFVSLPLVEQFGVLSEFEFLKDFLPRVVDSVVLEQLVSLLLSNPVAGGVSPVLLSWAASLRSGSGLRLSLSRSPGRGGVGL